MDIRNIAIAIVNRLNDSYNLNLSTIDLSAMTDDVVDTIDLELQKESEAQDKCTHPREHREYVGRNTLSCKVCGLEFE